MSEIAPPRQLKRWALTVSDDMLKATFPNGRFAPPATGQQIKGVESILGVPFPEQLRALYRECNGFQEDRGNAQYLLSLTEDDFSLIRLTRFHWNDIKENWPQLDLSPYIFFGSSSADEMWGINWKGSAQIIAYHHHMEGQFEIVGSNIIEVYKADYELYGEAS